MGRIFISPAGYKMRQMSPLESLLTGLVDPVSDGRLFYPAADANSKRHCDATHIFPRLFLGKEGPIVYPQPRRPWFQILDIGDFDPSEISVKLESKAVVVHAKRERREGDNFDLVERKRVVQIPEGIDTEKVSCFVGTDGRLFIRAPFVEQKPEAQIPESKSCPEVCSTSPECCQNARKRCDSAPTISIDKTVTQEKNTTKETMPEEAESALSTEKTEKPIKMEDESDAEADAEDWDVPSLKSLFEETNCLTAEEHEKNIEDKKQDGGKIDDTQSKAETSPLCSNPQEGSIRRTDDETGKKFEVSLNMKDFEPENISIRFVDKQLCVDAKQEVKKDGLLMMREVHRKYMIPENGAMDAAVAKVDARGLLNITVPLRSDDDKTRNVPIEKLE